MNSVELVKAVCKDKHIPISRLERECGFSNGYIAGLKKGVFPAQRLQVIADYLGVSMDYLMGEGVQNIGHQKQYYSDETYEMAQTIFDNPDLHALMKILTLCHVFKPYFNNFFTNVLLTAKKKKPPCGGLFLFNLLLRFYDFQQPRTFY